MECGLANLSSCIPEKLAQYFSYLLNSSILPLLKIIFTLLTSPVNISSFREIWIIITGLITFIQLFGFIWAGYMFMTSGDNIKKRVKAKRWFLKLIILLILIQCSFYLYGAIIDISSVISESMLNLVDKRIFLISIDSLPNFAVGLMFLIPYTFTLICTAILLSLRYFFVLIGTILFPLAISSLIFPPIQIYGRIILNILFGLIFIPFFTILILYGTKLMITLSPFKNVKILLMLVTFTCINIFVFLFFIISIIKALVQSLEDTNIKDAAIAGKLFLK